MLETLKELLTTNNNFMPHGHCYLWQPDILWTHVIADGLIALAYISIPTSISIIAWRHAHSPSIGIAMLFAAFIVLCGMTHLFNIYVIWNPAYELQSYLKGLTAIVSIATAIMIAVKTQHLVNLLNIEEINNKVSDMQAISNEKDYQLNQVLSAAESRELRIIELKEEINTLLIKSGDQPRYR